MERRRLVSHAEAERVLRNLGYSHERIKELLRDLPDPIDTERDGDEIANRGITKSRLMDRMGGSP